MLKNIVQSLQVELKTLKAKINESNPSFIVSNAIQEFNLMESKKPNLVVFGMDNDDIKTVRNRLTPGNDRAIESCQKFGRASPDKIRPLRLVMRNVNDKVELLRRKKATDLTRFS